MPDRWRKIDELFHAAAERAPHERAAFLDEACGGDESLRREVKSLLAADSAAEEMATAKLPAQVAVEMLDNPSPRLSAGQSLNQYRIISPLGAGGMGEVFLAEDTRLKRKVALKLLPAQFTSDPDRVRRFEQEARAASALNHPNIITLFDLGRAGEVYFMATEFIDGQTLRERLRAQEPLPLGESLEIALQICQALVAAHEAGIVHRDIKPENVMVRRDGIVKVLDFGLAKLTEPSAPAVDTQAPTTPGGSTESGVVMGTPRYMSPEQARGEKVDARTDIFSLGVMLYEMVAGRAPFVGATTSEVIAAILRDEPAPLAEPPPALERIVSRALRKDRAERYQTAKDLFDDLNQLKERLLVEKLVVPPSGGSLGRQVIPPEGGTTNTARKRLAIFVAAALSIAVIAGLAVWTYFDRKPAPVEKDTILLADFENKTGEAIFDGTLKQALAIQLQQSPFLNLFPEARVQETLRLMNRQPDARVTAEIAREICERQGIKALIAGTIAPLGIHYVITLEAINAQNGETLARQQTKAESREQALGALSQAARQLREKLGESLSSIQSIKPLAQDRTSKLEALKDRTRAGELGYQGRFVEAISFVERAVEIDPQYVAALHYLSLLYNATGQPESAAKYAEQAFLLRDRGNEFEKPTLTCWYHILVTGNQKKRLEALRLRKQTYPTFGPVYNDLALVYNMVGQSEQAVAEAREAIRLSPNFAAPYRILSLALLRLNQSAEAKETIRRAQALKLEETEYHLRLYQLAFIEGDAAEMQRQVEVMSGKPEEYAPLDWQTGAAAFAGEWRRALELSRRAIDLAVHFEMKEVAARYATEQALRGAVFGDCRQARADAAQGLKLKRGRASLPRAALALAVCGEANQAKSLVGELAKRYPEDTVINSIWLPEIRAAMELQRGNAGQAIDQLQAASRYEAAAEFWPQHLRGQAYLKLGRGAEAAAEFQKILDHRGHAPLSPLYPLAYLGLARAAALTSDRAKSQKAWENFFAAWKEADADLPVLSGAKREYEKR